MKKELSPWGKQCKMQMIVLNKNLTDISKETGLSKQYISSIINGRVLPPEDTLHTISKALDVDMALA